MSYFMFALQLPFKVYVLYRKEVNPQQWVWSLSTSNIPLQQSILNGIEAIVHFFLHLPVQLGDGYRENNRKVWCYCQIIKICSTQWLIITAQILIRYWSAASRNIVIAIDTNSAVDGMEFYKNFNYFPVTFIWIRKNNGVQLITHDLNLKKVPWWY